MNLACLPIDFEPTDHKVAPGRGPIVACIIDRNPVLSKCVSASLSAFQPLECHAEEFDPTKISEDVERGDQTVVVFDPAQIDGSARDYLGSIADREDVFSVAYSFDTSNETVNDVLDAGVDCFASKEQDLSILYLAIVTAAYGGRFLCPIIAQKFQRVHSGVVAPSQQQTDPKALLSARELAVLTALASGLSQKQTGFKLDLSDKTVSTYKSRAMRKLNLTDRASLMRFAVAQNLIATASHEMM